MNSLHTAKTDRLNELASQIEALCAESARMYDRGEDDTAIEARIDQITAEYNELLTA